MDGFCKIYKTQIVNERKEGEGAEFGGTVG